MKYVLDNELQLFQIIDRYRRMTSALNNIDALSRYKDYRDSQLDVENNKLLLKKKKEYYCSWVGHCSR